jgi:hypothetical protein
MAIYTIRYTEIMARTVEAEVEAESAEEAVVGDCETISERYVRPHDSEVIERTNYELIDRG